MVSDKDYEIITFVLYVMLGRAKYAEIDGAGKHRSNAGHDGTDPRRRGF